MAAKYSLTEVVELIDQYLEEEVMMNWMTAPDVIMLMIMEKNCSFLLVLSHQHAILISQLFHVK